jgi:hypothetical protein
MTPDVCKAIEVASRAWSGGTPSGAMLTTTRAFLAAAAEDTALLAEVAASLAGHEPGAAAWIAVTCGTAVERGAPAELSGPEVFKLLRSWLPRLPVARPQDLPPGLAAEQTASLELFQFLCQSAVTHAARLPALRAALANDFALVDRLGELQACSHGAVWVREALLKDTGTLVFLHPPGGTGLRLNYTNVSNCFHLFSLLQTAIGESVPGGRAPNAAIARVARGKSTEAVNDEAWWHYGDANSKRANLATSIWGERLVREIPVVEGERVIVAWPALLDLRSWDGGFLGPHLEAMPADVVVERQLTAAETEKWLQRLGIKAQKKWWRLGSSQ